MSTIVRSDEGPCAILTLNRPDSLNAITDGMLDELDIHLDTIETDASRAIIFNGFGRAFCVGSDLKEKHDGPPEERVKRMHALVQRLASFPKITVAAVHGFTLGGGLEIATGCTFRVASPDAKLGLPEIKLGLMPVYGGTQTVARLVGEAHALELMLSGNFIDGKRAYEIGLVNRLAASDKDLLTTACQLAESCCFNSLVAQRAIRTAVREGLDLPLSQGLALEAALGEDNSRSADAVEGVKAFVEKRDPVFSDR